VPTLRDGAPLRIGIEEVGITVSIDRSGFDFVLHLADVAIPSLARIAYGQPKGRRALKKKQSTT
jgi:hypothetical protein